MEQLLNKKIKIIYDDGNHVTFKIGIVTRTDESFVYLGSDLIAIQRIIRCEVLE